MPDPSKSASHSEETLQANRLSENRPKTTFFWVCCQLWRFLPDFIAVITGCLFANWKITTRKYIAPAMQFIFIPSGFIALIFILMLQRGSARFNLSRWFLGIHPVTTMGYASYALYLFQEPAFGFWAPYFYLAAPKGIGITEPIPEGDWYPVTKNFKVIRVLWFWNEPLGKQFLGVVVLQLICWLIHKYYQDKFVPFVYEKMHQCVAVCFKAKVYHNKLPTKNNLPIQNKELGDDLNNNWQPVFIASKTVV